MTSLDYRLSPTSTIGVGLGAGLGGVIGVTGPLPQRYQVLPGWELTMTYSHRVLSGRGSLPFLVFSVAAGASGASTALENGTAPDASLYAFDVRAGLLVGKTFWSTLSPYATARAFGGPILWGLSGGTLVGGDDYHVQLGFGLVTSLPDGFDVFVEGVPAIGERGVTLGVGKSL